MAGNVALKDLPEDLSVKFWPSSLTLRQRIRSKSFANEKYVSHVSLERGVGDVIVISGGIYHSQMKSAKPHSVTVSVDKVKVTDAHCSCKAG